MAEQKRAKGRLATQIRPLLCERGLLQRADGSARWVQDGSAVLAAIHGPAAAGARKEHPERAVVEVVFKPRNGLPGAKESELEEVLRQTVEGVLLASLHPRTLVTVVVQVLQADGSLLAAAVNAVCAALVDAGVPLVSLFAAVSAAIDAGGTLLVDPDAQEEAAAAALLTVAFPYRHELVAGEGAAAGGQQQQQQQQQLEVDDGMLMCHATGRLSVEQMAMALEAARRGCGGIATFTRMSLLAGFSDALVRSKP